MNPRIASRNFVTGRFTNDVTGLARSRWGLKIFIICNATPSLIRRRKREGVH
jgi:hypothetical protein